MMPKTVFVPKGPNLAPPEFDASGARRAATRRGIGKTVRRAADAGRDALVAVATGRTVTDPPPSDIFASEEFRRPSRVSPEASGTLPGSGPRGRAPAAESLARIAAA